MCNHEIWNDCSPPLKRGCTYSYTFNLSKSFGCITTRSFLLFWLHQMAFNHALHVVIAYHEIKVDPTRRLKPTLWNSELQSGQAPNNAIWLGLGVGKKVLLGGTDRNEYCPKSDDVIYCKPLCGKSYFTKISLCISFAPTTAVLLYFVLIGQG